MHSRIYTHCYATVLVIHCTQCDFNSWTDIHSNNRSKNSNDYERNNCTVESGDFYTVRRNIVKRATCQTKALPCRGVVEYLHRSPASRSGRRKGKSQIWESKTRLRVPQDSDPRMTALATTGSNCKRQTRSLIKESAPHQQTTRLRWDRSSSEIQTQARRRSQQISEDSSGAEARRRRKIKKWSLYFMWCSYRTFRVLSLCVVTKCYQLQ
jgi:hypothetical protein